MTQEVQTTLDRTQVPNRIEGIWLSERRIKEHYQVTPSFTFECEWTGSVTLNAGSGHRDAPETQWNLTITQSWMTEFSVINGAIRIPLAWGYMVKYELSWWSSNFSCDAEIRVSGETLFSATLTNTSSSKDTVIDFWKFDMVELWSSGYYSGSSTGATTYVDLTISIKKL